MNADRCHACGKGLVPLYRHTWTTWRAAGHDHCSHACATATLAAS